MASAVGSGINNAINGNINATGEGASVGVPVSSSIPVTQIPMCYRPKEYEVQVSFIYNIVIFEIFIIYK